MKKVILSIGLISTLGLSSCDVLSEAAGIVLTEGTESGTPALTNTEVISGLKEALSVGITNSVNLTSVTDGVYEKLKYQVTFSRRSY